MEYSPFVRQHAAAFGQSSLKLAADLAALLDSAVFSIECIKTQGFGVRRMAFFRAEVLEDLGAACAQSGVPVPDLERPILEMCLPSLGSNGTEKENVRKLVDAARQHLRPRFCSNPGCYRSDSEMDLEGLVACLKVLPGLASGYGDGLAVFRAAINLKLMAVGKPTIRQDPSLQVKCADGCLPPSRPLTAVVVDDDPLEICRTLRALAGWPSLTVVPFRFTPDLVPGSADDRSLAGQLLTAAARAILEFKPDIVIMDEGMPVVDGGQLIRAIRELNPRHQLEFVGNTGGMGEELRAAGAILNLKKGACLEPLMTAIQRFGRT